MKKVVGKSLVLGAIALGVLSLLGGPNVFSVLSNIKFPSKPQTEKPVEKEKEAIIEEKQEKETAATELALEVAKPSEEPVVVETVVQQEIKQEEVRIKNVEPKPEPEKQSKAQERTTPLKPIEQPAAPKSSGYSRRYLEDGTLEITRSSGEKIRYDKNGVRIWSSWHGRLIETKEEKAWRIKNAREKNQGSSGSEGKGVWCLTPSGNHNVKEKSECSSVPGWMALN